MRERSLLLEPDNVRPRSRYRGGSPLQPLPFAGERIYALAFLGACALWILPEIIASRLLRSSNSSNVRDRGSLRLISLLWMFGIILDIVLSFRLPQAAIS